jgi:hypothetical protein
MEDLENIENVEEVEVIPTDNTQEELQENVEQSTGEVSVEVSGEVTEPEDNSAEIEAEQERLRQEHEEYLNSFPDTTVWYRDLLVNGNVKSLGTVVRDPHIAEQWGFLDNHFDESELTYIGTKECGTYYLKGYEKPEPTEEEKMIAYEKKIESDIDNYLQGLVSSRGYDDVKSCVGYYNSTDETFQREARAISKHRDQLYRKGYELIAQCKKGEIDYRIIDLQYILNLIDPLDW